MCVPSGDVLLAVRVNWVLLFDGFGENDPVNPVGNPDTEKVALPVKPYSGLI